jgi:hypothetical protein
MNIGYSKNGAAWVWGGDDTYDDAYLANTTLNLCKDTELPLILRNLKMYDVKFSTARIEQMSGG